MPIRRPALTRRGVPASHALVALIALGGCSASSPTPTPADPAETAGAPSAAATPVPTPPATPTPEPTPRFTNVPDPDLEALLPDAINGIPLVVAAREDFALTPGDVGLVFGDIGLRFSSLVLAYVESPRLTLYALRVDAPPVSTADLEPHLAEAGRYVGIAGLDRAAWQLTAVGGDQVWTRGGDLANPPGTTLYAWAAGDLVFLLVGSDDALNRALVESLPRSPAAPAATSTEAPSSSPSDA
jgi:hypothetical protein